MELSKTANEMTVNGYFPMRRWQRRGVKRGGQCTVSIYLQDGHDRLAKELMGNASERVELP